MPNNKISPELISAVHAPPAGRIEARPPLLVRMLALLQAGRMDRMLAVGVPAPAGSALAVHAARITTVTERAVVVQSLRRAVASARERGYPVSSRVPVHRANVLAAEISIAAVVARLQSPEPVAVRGMARLRHVLSDGAGPLYFRGRGDLNGRLGAALAAL